MHLQGKQETSEMMMHLERLETELDALKRLGDLSMVLFALSRIEDWLTAIEEQLQACSEGVPFKTSVPSEHVHVREAVEQEVVPPQTDSRHG